MVVDLATLGVAGLKGVFSLLGGGSKPQQPDRFQQQYGFSTGNSNTNSSSSTRPVISDEWQGAYGNLLNSLNPYGATPDQQAAEDFFRTNMYDNFLTPAYGMVGNATRKALDDTWAGGQTIDSGINYLQSNQDIGSHTLDHWFPGWQGSAGATATYQDSAGAQAENVPGVAARTGAAFMAPYGTGLTNDYVNASLADYDAGAAQGFNALRARSADAFGNKRTGVAEGQFMADAARGRGTLGSNLRLTGFNTAAELGQADANRALAADTTNVGNLLNNNQFNANLAQANNQFNAGNLLNNSQFNANLTQANNQYNNSLLDARQRFDIGQADIGDDRRLGIARDLISAGGARAANAAAAQNIAAQNYNLANLFNSGRLDNARALAENSGMSLSQLINALTLGTQTFGSDTTGNSATTSNSFNGSYTNSQPNAPADPFGDLIRRLTQGQAAIGGG